MRWVSLLVALVLCSPAVAELRLNHIQVVGSHNSYKLAMSWWQATLLSLYDAEQADALEYAHPPLSRQLSIGLRSLELDVFYDPDATLYGNEDSAFAVMHVQTVDNNSNCITLRACLTEIVRWSDAHPTHIPLFITVNAKDAVIDAPGFDVPLPFDANAWDALDGELRALLGTKLITPKEVFAEATLQWPVLDDARGRILMVLDERGAKRDSYTHNGTKWRERAMFTNQPIGAPGAAVMILNDPVEQADVIQAATTQGLIVRTRADADTVEARSGSTRRRDAAFASGAHIISTDYYLPDQGFGNGYYVPVTQPARCNPLTAPEDCQLGEE